MPVSLTDAYMAVRDRVDGRARFRRDVSVDNVERASEEASSNHDSDRVA